MRCEISKLPLPLICQTFSHVVHPHKCVVHAQSSPTWALPSFGSGLLLTLFKYTVNLHLIFRHSAVCNRAPKSIEGFGRCGVGDVTALKVGKTVPPVHAPIIIIFMAPVFRFNYIVRVN